MPPELLSHFEASKQQLITASAKWQLIEQLFAKTQARSQLLTRIGSGFFALIKDSLVTDVMISLGRLLDKPHHKGNDNLTLERLGDTVMKLGNDELAQKLDVHLKKARGAEFAARRYRNKRLAHNDLKSILDQEANPLPAATVGDVRKMLHETGEFLNSIDLHYCRSTTAFGLAMIDGDANSLVSLVRDGLLYRQNKLNVKRLEAGMDPVDWSIPDDA